MANDYDTTGAESRTAAQLGRLNDLDEFKVADGYPDIRGWEVKTGDGQKVGKVGDLIVDTQAMRVRYLDVELDRSVGRMARDAATPGDQEGHTLLPIGNVQLDDAHDDVMVSGYTLDQIAGLPRYGGQTITSDYETTLRDRHRERGAAGMAGAAAGIAGMAAGAGDDRGYDAEDYDDQRLYASRRARQPQGDNAQRLTLAEEQLAVGKRQTSAGEVELRKTVDTERVQEQVQLRHDEVTVERRPVTDPSRVGAADNQIGDDEIRIPIMEEQVVMTKVMVPREEIIVRKKQVTEQETVSADVRRERLDTSGVEQQQHQQPQHQQHQRGLLDRAADKLDDVKDRVDGNPASKPGPDATDRRI